MSDHAGEPLTAGVSANLEKAVLEAPGGISLAEFSSHSLVLSEMEREH